MAEVAVIGAGATGLTTLKNLLEEGYKVTAFECDAEIGGIWNVRDDSSDRPSVLESTITNNSTDFGCYTDFPYPNGCATYASAHEVSLYIRAYADHFNLLPHIRLGTNVRRARLTTTVDGVEKWELAIMPVPDGGGPAEKEEEELRYFDKLVVASGSISTPNRPEIPGLERFEGSVLHSSAYKRPADFNGLNVLVVGTGNTAADTIGTLKGHAKQVYWSHRPGAIILPRRVNDKPLDHFVTHRMTRIGDTLTHYFPSYAGNAMQRTAVKIQNAAFNIRPEWSLTPAPSLRHAFPIVTDDLIAELEAGRAISVPRIKQITGNNTVKFEDCSSLDNINAILFCTGYKKTDWSLVGDDLDPTRHMPARWINAKGSSGRPLPRLYQNIFSLDRPQSLAYIGVFARMISGFATADLASMALAQVWKGNSALPSLDEMNKDVDTHHASRCAIAEGGSCSPHAVETAKWSAWAHEAAGTRVDAMLGYGIAGWWFWVTDRAFCNMLMGGVMSPFIFRLFPSQKRQAWSGAREAIEVLDRERKGKIFPSHGGEGRSD